MICLQVCWGLLNRWTVVNEHVQYRRGLEVIHWFLQIWKHFMRFFCARENFSNELLSAIWIDCSCESAALFSFLILVFWFERIFKESVSCERMSSGASMREQYWCPQCRFAARQRLQTGPLHVLQKIATACWVWTEHRNVAVWPGCISRDTSVLFNKI